MIFTEGNKGKKGLKEFVTEGNEDKKVLRSINNK